MDDREKLLYLCRELHARMSDALNADKPDQVSQLIWPLIEPIRELAEKCGYMRLPIEFYSLGEYDQWQSWTIEEGWYIRHDGWPDKEWWRESLNIIATWVRGLESGIPTPAEERAEATTGQEVTTIEGYTQSVLESKLVMSRPVFAKHRDAAGIDGPGTGNGGMKYSPQDVVIICQQIIERGMKRHQELARSLLSEIQSAISANQGKE